MLGVVTVIGSPTYDATWCWSHVFLLGVVIALNFHLMMLHGVANMSALWELSSYRIISLLCCMVSKSGRLSPGARTAIELSMAYLSSTSVVFMDLMFFFLKRMLHTVIIKTRLTLEY